MTWRGAPACPSLCLCPCHCVCDHNCMSCCCYFILSAPDHRVRTLTAKGQQMTLQSRGLQVQCKQGKRNRVSLGCSHSVALVVMGLGGSEAPPAMVTRTLQPFGMNGCSSVVACASVVCGVGEIRSSPFFGVTAHSTRAL